MCVGGEGGGGEDSMGVRGEGGGGGEVGGRMEEGSVRDHEELMGRGEHVCG